MAKTPEILFDLVPQKIKVVAAENRNTKRAQMESFKPPKRIVFREDASLLSQREQELVLEFLKGKTNHQIASNLYISSRTVKRHWENIAEHLINEGLTIYGGRIEIVTSLLQAGELELRGPEMKKGHPAKSRLYTRRTEDELPPEYPLTDPLVISALHDGVGITKLNEAGITENWLNNCTELLMKGDYPRESNSRG